MLAQQTPEAPQVEAPAEEIEQGALRLWEAFLESLPRIGVAITFIVAGWILSRLVRSSLRSYWSRNHTESFTRVLSKVVSWIVLGLFVLAAITVTFPSVKPVDLLAGLGFFSIAIGFAFQDILENTLSGVLLLFRQPFQSGDQIKVNGIEGTVEGITIRETRLYTFDGRLVIIPNADVYKSAIVVTTDKDIRRDSFLVGVAYEEDLGNVKSLITNALSSVQGVSSDRPPETLISELGTSTVNLQARFWTKPTQHNVLQVRSEAIDAVKTAMDDAGIEMPCDIVALQATDSFASALHDKGAVTPSGSLAS